MQFHSKFEHFLVLCGNWETNSKMYMVMKSTHNSKAILRSKKKEYLFYQLFSESEKKVKVTQSCLTLCDPMDYTVYGILQDRMLDWVAVPFSKGIFPTQGSSPGLLHCRQILYQLSHQGSLTSSDFWIKWYV